jgi:hypothetical protein
MTNPLGKLQSISRTKAIILAGSILALFCMVSFIVQIPTMGQNRLIDRLENAGFRGVTIGTISYDMGGLRAENVTLDPHGFDKVATIEARYSWPKFLSSGKVDEIKVSGLMLSRSGKETSLVMQSLLQNLTRAFENRLIIDKAILDFTTLFGELRFTLDATVEPQTGDGAPQKVIARVAANQYQLGFVSNWSGTLSPEGALSMSAEIADGRLHFGPVEITRYAGWVTLEAGGEQFSLQSQIDAGGAATFKIPMQDISLVTDITGSANTVLFRSSMAGLNDVTLTSDWTRGQNKVNQFDVTLKGQNMQAFFERIAAERQGASIPDTFKQKTPFQVQATYQAERRFAGGPLPFSLEGTRGTEKMAFGTFLIYPEQMDLRGSAEIDPALTKAIASFFDIKADHIDRNFIRLDADLGPVLGIKLPEKEETATE